jgi:hypothetical protein
VCLHAASTAGGVCGVMLRVRNERLLAIGIDVAGLAVTYAHGVPLFNGSCIVVNNTQMSVHMESSMPSS